MKLLFFLIISVCIIWLIYYAVNYYLESIHFYESMESADFELLDYYNDTNRLKTSDLELFFNLKEIDCFSKKEIIDTFNSYIEKINVNAKHQITPKYKTDTSNKCSYVDVENKNTQGMLIDSGDSAKFTENDKADIQAKLTQIRDNMDAHLISYTDETTRIIVGYTAKAITKYVADYLNFKEGEDVVPQGLLKRNAPHSRKDLISKMDDAKTSVQLTDDLSKKTEIQFDTETGFTVMGWIKADKSSNVSKDIFKLEYSSLKSTTPTYGLKLSVDANRQVVLNGYNEYYNYEQVRTGKRLASSSSVPSVGDNDWHHFAFTVNKCDLDYPICGYMVKRSTWGIYNDGNLVQELRNQLYPCASKSNEIKLNQCFLVNDMTNCRIRHFKIFSDILTEAEIQAEINATEYSVKYEESKRIIEGEIMVIKNNLELLGNERDVINKALTDTSNSLNNSEELKTKVGPLKERVDYLYSTIIKNARADRNIIDNSINIILAESNDNASKGYPIQTKKNEDDIKLYRNKILELDKIIYDSIVEGKEKLSEINKLSGDSSVIAQNASGKLSDVSLNSMVSIAGYKRTIDESISKIKNVITESKMSGLPEIIVIISDISKYESEMKTIISDVNAKYAAITDVVDSIQKKHDSISQINIATQTTLTPINNITAPKPIAPLTAYYNMPKEERKIEDKRIKDEAAAADAAAKQKLAAEIAAAKQKSDAEAAVAKQKLADEVAAAKKVAKEASDLAQAVADKKTRIQLAKDNIINGRKKIETDIYTYFNKLIQNENNNYKKVLLINNMNAFLKEQLDKYDAAVKLIPVETFANYSAFIPSVYEGIEDVETSAKTSDASIAAANVAYGTAVKNTTDSVKNRKLDCFFSTFMPSYYNDYMEKNRDLPKMISMLDQSGDARKLNYLNAIKRIDKDTGDIKDEPYTDDTQQLKDYPEYAQCVNSDKQFIATVKKAQIIPETVEIQTKDKICRVMTKMPFVFPEYMKYYDDSALLSQKMKLEPYAKYEKDLNKLISDPKFDKTDSKYKECMDMSMSRINELADSNRRIQCVYSTYMPGEYSDYESSASTDSSIHDNQLAELKATDDYEYYNLLAYTDRMNNTKYKSCVNKTANPFDKKINCMVAAHIPELYPQYSELRNDAVGLFGLLQQPSNYYTAVKFATQANKIAANPSEYEKTVQDYSWQDRKSSGGYEKKYLVDVTKKYSNYQHPYNKCVHPSTNVNPKNKELICAISTQYPVFLPEYIRNHISKTPAELDAVPNPEFQNIRRLVDSGSLKNDAKQNSCLISYMS